MNKPSERKFYRTVVQYEILSEEPVGEVSLADIFAQCTEGAWSGHFLETKQEGLDGPTMAKHLQAQGSDPEFFNLTEDGADVE